MSEPEFFTQPQDKVRAATEQLTATEQALEEAFARWETLENMRNGA